MAGSHRGQRGWFQNGVNFGIFKNHSGGPTGDQISTEQSQIYISGGGWPPTEFLSNYNFGKFPQPVSLSFFGQNSMGYIPATLGHIGIKFTGYVEATNICGYKLSKSGVIPRFGPQGESNFQVDPHCWPPGGQIYAHIPLMLCGFGRTLDPLKNLPYMGP